MATAPQGRLPVALTIPFRLRGFDGHVTVRYGANDDPASWGFDLLRLPFEIARVRGFPVCEAEIAYGGTGYRAFMGWIQVITVTPHDTDSMPAASWTAIDLLPVQAPDETPFTVFGSAPTFFDAPGPNPPRSDETWLAETFLAIVPDVARSRQIAALLGFSWGYALRAGQPTLLAAAMLGAEDWNKHLAYLGQHFPSWRFEPNFASPDMTAP